MVNAGLNLDAHEYSSERNTSRTYLTKDDLSKKVCNIVIMALDLLLIW